jgi:hypothetical protein
MSLTPARAWEQIPGESVQDFEAFGLYLSGKSIDQVTIEIGRNCAPLSARARWTARRLAYLQALQHEATAGALEAARDIGAEHAAMALALRTSALDGIKTALIRGDVSVKDQIKILEMCTNWERIDRGASTGKIDLDFSTRTDQELAELDRLLNRKGGQDGRTGSDLDGGLPGAGGESADATEAPMSDPG